METCNQVPIWNQQRVNKQFAAFTIHLLLRQDGLKTYPNLHPGKAQNQWADRGADQHIIYCKTKKQCYSYYHIILSFMWFTDFRSYISFRCVLMFLFILNCYCGTIEMKYSGQNKKKKILEPWWNKIQGNKQIIKIALVDYITALTVEHSSLSCWLLFVFMCFLLLLLVIYLHDVNVPCRWIISWIYRVGGKLRTKIVVRFKISMLLFSVRKTRYRIM